MFNKTFAEVYYALMMAQTAAINNDDENLLVQTQKAIKCLHEDFRTVFPSSVLQLQKLANHDYHAVFAVMAEFPNLFELVSSKFLQLVANIIRHEYVFGDEAIVTFDANCIKIIASQVVNDYAGKISNDREKSEEFSQTIIAILPKISQDPIENWEVNLVEKLLPEWEQAFPVIIEEIRLEKTRRKYQNHGENWL